MTRQVWQVELDAIHVLRGYTRSRLPILFKLMLLLEETLDKSLLLRVYAGCVNATDQYTATRAQSARKLDTEHTELHRYAIYTPFATHYARDRSNSKQIKVSDNNN